MWEGKDMVLSAGCWVPGAFTQHPALSTQHLCRYRLTRPIEQSLHIGNARDIGQSGADVLPVGDALREPSDHGAGLVQLPLLRLRGRFDLVELALHGVDAALDL